MHLDLGQILRSNAVIWTVGEKSTIVLRQFWRPFRGVLCGRRKLLSTLAGRKTWIAPNAF
jgi:hypothetical protein